MLGHRLTGFQAMCRVEWHQARCIGMPGVWGVWARFHSCWLHATHFDSVDALGLRQWCTAQDGKRSLRVTAEVKIMKGSDGGADPNKRLGMLKNMVCPSADGGAVLICGAEQQQDVWHVQGKEDDEDDKQVGLTCEDLCIRWPLTALETLAECTPCLDRLAPRSSIRAGQTSSSQEIVQALARGARRVSSQCAKA